MAEAQRVQKLLAQAGIASRRKCEEMIKEGRVSVNGTIVGIGTSATTTDDIRVDGKKVAFEEKVYIMLNKPVGVTSTVSDPHARMTVLDLVKVPQRIFPVGRLDKETEGLLLLTNDGELMQHITHPSHGVTKTYVVNTERAVSDEEIMKLRQGIMLEGKKVQVNAIEKHAPTFIQLTIHEGMKHIVRNLFAALNHNVKRLVRVKLGTLDIGNLDTGKSRPLTPAELARLKKAAGL